MARCSHCGTVNRDGAVFCQNCGQRIEEAASKPAAPVASSGHPSLAASHAGASGGHGAAAAGAGPKCASCGTVNAVGMNFCKMCGSSLAAAPAQVAEANAAKIICVSCGKQTPSGFAFCQHCGHKLGAAAPRAVTSQSNSAVAATMIAEAPVLGAAGQPHLPTPPAGMPRPTGAGAAVGGGLGAPSGTSKPPSAAFAATVGPGDAQAVLDVMGRAPGAPVSTVKTSPVSEETLPEPRIYATLVVVRRDGSDGDSVRVTTPTIDIGRTEGGLNFAEDVYLSARHVRLSFESGSAVARALDVGNGVYVRLRGAIDLAPGDQFLVGKEVIRYETISPEERDVPISEHGVRVFGTVPRESWARLRQITASGTTRDVWHISRADLVLGREEGDVTFPDDEFMSRRHAAVRRGTPRAKLEDLNSSNGTFIRLRGDHVLRSGDLLRFGDQLLRVEL